MRDELFVIISIWSRNLFAHLKRHPQFWIMRVEILLSERFWSSGTSAASILAYMHNLCLAYGKENYHISSPRQNFKNLVRKFTCIAKIFQKKKFNSLASKLRNPFEVTNERKDKISTNPFRYRINMLIKY